jgi:hypothetical protein
VRSKYTEEKPDDDYDEPYDYGNEKYSNDYGDDVEYNDDDYNLDDLDAYTDDKTYDESTSAS